MVRWFRKWKVLLKVTEQRKELWNMRKKLDIVDLKSDPSIHWFMYVNIFKDECQIQSRFFCTALLNYLPARKMCARWRAYEISLSQNRQIRWSTCYILSNILLKSNCSDFSQITSLSLLSLNCLFVLELLPIYK